MTFQENFPLRSLNSFHVQARANYFTAFNSVTQLAEALSSHQRQETLILGGGSNILFTKDYPGIILKNEIRGIELIREDDDHAYLRAGAGENWHGFVLHCIHRELAGVENLSLIPGNVGASPMQNIGAYGVEIKDVFYELEAFHLRDKKLIVFSAADCEFGYRESIFKTRFKDEFAIVSVTFRLNKKPLFNTSYGAVEQELQKMNVNELSIKAISQAVVNIRSSKLPDPAQLGNAGSFFKNPAVPIREYESLAEKFPGIPGYPAAHGMIKLAAGWMIEKCGWKGYREGDAGCHALQALVLINYGNASGKQIYALSQRILDSVYKKFSVMLEREVNII